MLFWFYIFSFQVTILLCFISSNALVVEDTLDVQGYNVIWHVLKQSHFCLLLKIVSWAKVWLSNFLADLHLCKATIWISFRKSRGQRLIFGFGVLNLVLVTSPMLEDDLDCFEIDLSTTWHFFYQIEYYIEEIAAAWFWYWWKGLFLFFSFHFYFPFCPFRKIVRKLRSMQESRLFPGFETVRLLLNGRDAESRQTLLQNCP